MPTDEEENAAFIIQDKWDRFLEDRMTVGFSLYRLANATGKKIESHGDAVQYLEHNKILVQVITDNDNFLNQHSCFFQKGYKRSHLRLLGVSSNVEDRPQYYSKYAINEKHNPGFNLLTSPPGQAKHAVIVIKEPLPYTVDHDAPLKGLIRSKALFLLDDKYTHLFDIAFKIECIHFKHYPYSFGVFYNCHIFVRNVLRRLQNMVDSN
ncbi:hypothetical protein [Enterobacter sp. Bisph1]|uniref:hypothetical protein n=1 Tax=Enterobacter sp. Bisph1 TaxID=1274399 RepID=UPI00057C262B|nr:hypothetical protein [Enterobacter sp. Bisph1]